MIWHGLSQRKIAEYTNPSNTLYNSLSSYCVEFCWKTGLLILAFKCGIYGRVFSRPWEYFINIRDILVTVLNYSSYETIPFYLFLLLPSVYFIYLFNYSFILCICFLTFKFYINWCPSPATCFISYHSCLNFSHYAQDTVGGVVMVVVCTCVWWV